MLYVAWAQGLGAWSRSQAPKGGQLKKTAFFKFKFGTNGCARCLPTWVDKTTTNFFGQRTGLTDIKTVRGAKKTAIVRRIACQSRKSGFFTPVRPNNETFATPRAPYVLLADTCRISPIDTRYRPGFGVCPSRARGPALWRQRRFRERRTQ